MVLFSNYATFRLAPKKCDSLLQLIKQVWTGFVKRWCSFRKIKPCSMAPAAPKPPNLAGCLANVHKQNVFRQ